MFSYKPLLVTVLLSLALASCGTLPSVPQAQPGQTQGTPSGVDGASKDPRFAEDAALRAQMCPIEALEQGISAQSVCPPYPDPEPDPEPQPPVTPPLPSEALFGPKPQVVATDYLSQVGFSEPNTLFQEKWQTLCEIHLEAQQGRPWGAETLEKNCSGSPQSGYTLVQVRIRADGTNRCSYSSNLLRAGTDFKFLEEIDEKYKRALEEIKLSVTLSENEKAELSAKLGEMRRYHKTVLEATSKLDVGTLWARTSGKNWWGGRGWCDLVLEGLVMKV